MGLIPSTGKKKNTSKTKALWEQGQNKEAKTKRLMGNLFAVSEVKITWVGIWPGWG